MGGSIADVLSATSAVDNNSLTYNQANGAQGIGDGIYDYNSVLALLDCKVMGNKVTTDLDDLFSSP
jgi:hypothetical protein